MNTATDLEYAAFVGIDWSDRKHDVCLQAAGGKKHEFSELAHRPEAIAQWAQALRQRFEGRPIAVCVELSKGHWSMRCSSTTSWCSIRSTRPRWRSIARRFV